MEIIMKGYKEVPLEISAGRLIQLPAGSYLAADMRDEYSCGYGMLDGAVRVGEEELRAFWENGTPIPALIQAMETGIPIVLYCKYGRISLDAAEALREKGFGNFCSLEGGYGAWALEESRRAAADEERRHEIEKALRKTFRHDLIGRFEKAVVQYSLVEEGDRIAVCISGGKDSMLMAKLFQELKRHNKFPFELFFVCMDPGYSPENRSIIENNARLLGIPIEFFETDIFDAVYNIEKSPCYLCARMRRGYLYRFAKDHGCNKIACDRDNSYGDAVFRPVPGDDAQTSKHEFRGDGTHPSHVSDPGKGHHTLARQRRTALSAVRLQIHAELLELRRRRHIQFQETGDEKTDCRIEGDGSPGGEQYFPGDGKRGAQ